MHSIKINKLIRSRRRTISLSISPDAALTVRAPFFVSLSHINELIFEKKDWINKKRIQILKNGEPPKPKEFINNEEFYFLGKIHKLKFENRKGLSLRERKEKIIKWYKRQALQKITERAHYWSRITGWKFSSISITKAEKRWGSCSRSNSINFSWKLIMAPPDVIDYVVVHELAHIPEKNHSAKFWSKVESVLPDYKAKRKWLRENIGKFIV